jgi:hypothetical protein
MINHNTKAATHRRNWAPAPAIQVGATSDWPITSAKASLANSRASALGEKDNRTMLGGGYKMENGLCWFTTRQSRSFNMRKHNFGGLQGFNCSRSSLLTFTIQLHEVSTNAHGIPFLVR